MSSPDATATTAAIALGLWQAGGGVVLVNVRHENGWQTALSAAVASAVYDAPQLGVENPPADPTQATLDAAGGTGRSRHGLRRSTLSLNAPTGFGAAG